MRNVGTVGEYLCPGRHDVVGRNIVSHLEHRFCVDLTRQRFGFWERLNIRPTKNFYILGFLFVCRRFDHIVVDDELIRHADLRRVAEFSRISKVTGQRRRSGNFRRYKIDACVLRSASALKVSVECAK